jgi:acyl carrier protein
MTQKKISESVIRNVLLSYLKKGNPILAKLKKIPMDRSLLELGYIDSFGVIEIVNFLEKSFKIKIEDDELTKEKFGSINKMVFLVMRKI